LIEGGLFSDLESILSDSQYLTQVAKQNCVSSFNYDIQDGFYNFRDKIKGTSSELIINAWGNEQNNIISKPEITFQILYNRIQQKGYQNVEIKNSLLDKLIKSAIKGNDDQFTHWLLMTEKANKSSHLDSCLILCNKNIEIKFLNFCDGNIVNINKNQQLIEVIDISNRINIKQFKIQNQFLDIERCLISPDRNHILVYTESGNDSDYLIVSVIDSYGNIVSQCEILDEYRYSILFVNSNNVLLANQHTLSMWDFISNNRPILLEIEKGYIISKADINLKQNIIALYFEASECQLVHKLSLYNLCNNSLVLIREIETIGLGCEFNFCENGNRIAYRDGSEKINIYDFSLNKISLKKVTSKRCFMLNSWGDKLYFNDFESLNCVFEDLSIKKILYREIDHLYIYNELLCFLLDNCYVCSIPESDLLYSNIDINKKENNVFVNNSEIIMNPHPHLLISSDSELLLSDFGDKAKSIYKHQNSIDIIATDVLTNKVFIKDSLGNSSIFSISNLNRDKLPQNRIQKKYIYRNNLIVGITNTDKLEIINSSKIDSLKTFLFPIQKIFPPDYDIEKPDVMNHVLAFQYYPNDNIIIYAILIKSNVSEQYLSLHIIDTINFVQTEYQHCIMISNGNFSCDICYPYLLLSTNNEFIIYFFDDRVKPNLSLYVNTVHNFNVLESSIICFDETYYIILKNQDLLFYSITDKKFSGMLLGIEKKSFQYFIDGNKFVNVSSSNNHNIYQFKMRRDLPYE